MTTKNTTTRSQQIEAELGPEQPAQASASEPNPTPTQTSAPTPTTTTKARINGLTDAKADSLIASLRGLKETPNARVARELTDGLLEAIGKLGYDDEELASEIANHLESPESSKGALAVIKQVRNQMRANTGSKPGPKPKSHQQPQSGSAASTQKKSPDPTAD